MSEAADATWRPLPALSERVARGERARKHLPRRELAEIPDATRDPLGILDGQNATRVPDLVPVRRERMAASPFAFYRGTAALMAADLAAGPSSGILVPSCGDAHVANFGFYASPQRRLVFDLNDFDEAAWAPWEWDVKRLATSIVVAGQATDRAPERVREACESAVRTYARALATAVALAPTERYFAHVDLGASVASLGKRSRKIVLAAQDDARRRTGVRAARRLTRRGDDGRVRFIETPPTMTHVDDDVLARVDDAMRQYAASASVDVQMLLRHYEVADVVRRVVGVGSVGTRCYLVALQDGDGSVLIMQAKEAGRSVLMDHGGVRQPVAVDEKITAGGEGARVVGMQRVLQAASDPLLGHLRGHDGSVDMYVRQFHDMKGGIDAETLPPGAFARYAQACAVVLARAHAQAPEAGEVVGYIGGGTKAAKAITTWAHAYADLSRADHAAFVGAGA